jgi:hypothetical protein
MPQSASLKRAFLRGAPQSRGSIVAGKCFLRINSQTHTHTLALSRKIDFLKDFETGLPDFSRYNIPKRGKNIPTEHKAYQMADKYTVLVNRIRV